MRSDAYRNAHKRVLAALLLAASTALLSSCGGGGAAADPTIGGDLHILPDPGTAYAGVPFTVTIAGGRRPYALGSSEPSIFPVPAILNGNIFQVVPENPGVVDVGLQPNEVPRRAVVLTARDANGQLNTADYAVLQNFLTGYGVSYFNNCPPPAGAAVGAAIQACAGGETAVTLAATSNGYRRGNALFRFERLRGDFLFTQCVSPPPVNPVLVNAITQNTDHQGIATVCLRVTAGAGTQIATYRVIDVATGVYTDQLFTISGGAAGGSLTAIPSTITFTGGSNLRCGTGSADVFVFDGTPPYTANSTHPSVSTSPSSSPTNPGRFTITQINTNPPCITGVTVVLLDSLGRRGTVTVDQVIGPAPSPITAAPAALTLVCGATGAVAVAGGSGTYTVTSTDPTKFPASVSGNIVSISHQPAVPILPPVTQTATVTVTDGASFTAITVTGPTDCM